MSNEELLDALEKNLLKGPCNFINVEGNDLEEEIYSRALDGIESIRYALSDLLKPLKELYHLLLVSGFDEKDRVDIELSIIVIKKHILKYLKEDLWKRQ